VMEKFSHVLQQTLDTAQAVGVNDADTILTVAQKQFEDGDAPTDADDVIADINRRMSGD